MFSTKKTKALSSAQKTLEARGKISAAIHEEETRLGALVIERVKAEQLLSVAEAGAALDEPGADVSGAESGLAKAKTAIDKSSAKLAALRGRLVLMAGELATARSAVKGELPAHVEALKTDFAVEWTKGIEAFGQLMGKRAALEARIGKIEMKAPSAAAIELPEEINAPWNVIAAVEEVISEIGGWERSALAPEVDGMAGLSKPYDPTAVYVAVSQYSGFAPGTLLVDASLVPGGLNHLVQIGYAEPLKAADWKKALSGGSQAENAIRSENSAEAQRELNAKLTGSISALVSQSPETRSSREIPQYDQPARYSLPIQRLPNH
jgi:hypothetical protein